jgi:hypothetical protein
VTIEFVDPRGQPSAAVEPYVLAVDLHDGPAAVGLLANGFFDSVAFLDQVAEALADAVPGVTIHRYDKGDASSMAPDQLLDGISAECAAVVTAYGH